MKTVCLTQESCPLKSRAEMEQIIAEVMDGAEYKAKLTFCCGVMLDMSYTDFKPVAEVKSELTRRIPYLQIERLDRWYSDKTIVTTLCHMDNHQPGVWMYDIEGRLCHMNAGLLVEAYLSGKTIESKPRPRRKRVSTAKTSRK